MYYCTFLAAKHNQQYQSENPNQNKIPYKHYRLATYTINYLQNPNQPFTKPNKLKEPDQTPNQEQVLSDQTHTSQNCNP